MRQKTIPPYKKWLIANSPETPRFTFVDLFSGAGGMRSGMELAGGECVFCCDNNRYANQLYFSNFWELPEGDLTQIDPETIPDHDVLCAGVPFKRLNKLINDSEKVIEDSPFELIWNVIKAKRPSAFLMEFSALLLRTDNSWNYYHTKKALRELNYNVFAFMVDSVDFIPVHKDRICLIGFDQERYGNDYDFKIIPHPLENRLSLGECLEDESEVEDFIISKKLWGYHHKHTKTSLDSNCKPKPAFRVYDDDDIIASLDHQYSQRGGESCLIWKTGPRPRKLSPREFTRIFGFPDCYNLSVCKSNVYLLIGASSVPFQIKDIAEQLFDMLDKLKDNARNGQTAIITKGELLCDPQKQLARFRTLKYKEE